MLAYQDQHRSTCVASKLCKLQKFIFIVLMGKLDISFGLVSPVSVLLRLVCVVCIIILNYADLSPICLQRNCCTVGGHLSPGVRDHHEGGDHTELGEQTIWPHHSANITTHPLSPSERVAKHLRLTWSKAGLRLSGLWWWWWEVPVVTMNCKCTQSPTL